MKITSDLFAAYLKCPTKCWLRSRAEVGTGNEYADWVRAQNVSYQRESGPRLLANIPENERVITPTETENIKSAKWRLAVDLSAQTPTLESRLHAVERVPSEGRGKPAQFIPSRFVFTNKLTKDDRLLVAFDALVLSEMLGRDVSLGRVIHGDDHVTLKVKTLAQVKEVRKRVEKIGALLSGQSPPDLVLNRHCAECEYRDRCRPKAIEKDDLSLLAGMSAKERQKLRSKGIFTVTQLSYTFRPRRRPKRMRDKREKYHHALKALAIREKKIHIVGSPELKIEGTPVYLDVEGLPDRDFYYLTGVRIGNGESTVQHSLWADSVEDEGKIWRDFLGILETIEKPVLIHYGSYEQTFVKAMIQRHGKPMEDTVAAKALGALTNLASFLFAQLYFPTATNSLKEIAGWLGSTWPCEPMSGLHSIKCRQDWEISRSEIYERLLVEYNVSDCAAVERLVTELRRLLSTQNGDLDSSNGDAVYTDSLKCDLPYRFGKVEYAVPEFEYINKTAYWDYQREKVEFRTERNSKSRTRSPTHTQRSRPISMRVFESPLATVCPKCSGKPLKLRSVRRVVQDLKFTRSGLSRTVVKHIYRVYRCRTCGVQFTNRSKEWPKYKEGSGLLAFVMYQLIQQRVPRRSVAHALSVLFGFGQSISMIGRLKSRAYELYKTTREQMLRRLVKGRVIHADETHASLGGKRVFIWVFCNAHEAIYLQADNREGAFLREMIKDFRGVLVSDFYAAYDSLPCPQQKCLVHLLRDLNNDLLKHPYDEDMKWLAGEFGSLLKPMITTIDRFGLKRLFLHKHKRDVKAFFKRLSKQTLKSELAQKYRHRFTRHQQNLFTFLDCDGVPWNNNSAEHAVKAFVMLRKQIRGTSSKIGIDEYLVMMSLYETCRRKEVSFLDFLRSGEKDIEKFAESRRRKRKQSALPKADEPQR